MKTLVDEGKDPLDILRDLWKEIEIEYLLRKKKKRRWFPVFRIGGGKMKKLSEHSIEELEAELEKKKKVKEESEKPKVIPMSDDKLPSLQKQCAEYLDEVESGCVSDDTEHYIFESAVELFYGKGVWDWVDTQSHN